MQSSRRSPEPTPWAGLCHGGGWPWWRQSAVPIIIAIRSRNRRPLQRLFGVASGATSPPSNGRCIVTAAMNFDAIFLARGYSCRRSSKVATSKRCLAASRVVGLRARANGRRPAVELVLCTVTVIRRPMSWRRTAKTEVSVAQHADCLTDVAGQAASRIRKNGNCPLHGTAIEPPSRPTMFPEPV